MGSRCQAHQLSNGLCVSVRPEPRKGRIPTMTSTSVPYTGGDISKSGELGKMFDIAVDQGSNSKKSGPSTSRSASFGGVSKHGEPIKKASGPQSGELELTPNRRQNSDPVPPFLPRTGLISGPLNSSGAPQKTSGPSQATGSMKLPSSNAVRNPAVTVLSQSVEYSFRKDFPKAILCSLILLFVMGFTAGAFILVAVHSAVLLTVVTVLCGLVAAFFTWNTYRSRRAIIGFISSFPESDLRTANNGEFVKISGVVTCGRELLESSFQKVPKCIYTSASLYKYRGWGSKAADCSHSPFRWGMVSHEGRLVDFYISDSRNDSRAQVKTGYGAKVIPYVDRSIVMRVSPANQESNPEFVDWLRERNLPSDYRTMCLEEGYVKEGDTVSVMGVIQRNENLIMIEPPSEPIATVCQWTRCIFPASLEGIVLRCEDTSSNDDVIMV